MKGGDDDDDDDEDGDSDGVSSFDGHMNFQSEVTPGVFSNVT